jgi:PQQ-dependent catabolism-associated CXXCW motif protein
MKKMIAWFCLLYSCSQILSAQEQQATHNKPTPWPSSLEDESELYTVEGYRLFRYRSPTPEQHDQATTVSTQQLVALLKQTPTPVLLDVQPLIWKSGFFIEKEPRLHIPGSRWIPNVGQGELEEAWAGYFQQHLQDVTQGRQDHPIVIYCTADCWMSWNAVKRAAQWGYSQLYWYRDGSDGWQEADLETAEGTPEKFTP